MSGTEKKNLIPEIFMLEKTFVPSKSTMLPCLFVLLIGVTGLLGNRLGVGRRGFLVQVLARPGDLQLDPR